MTDRSWNHIQLTDNIDLFTVFVDPKFIPDKKKLIGLFTPILYDHLCVSYGVQTPDPLQCIKNVELFSRQDLVPDQFGEFVSTGSQLFYVLSGDYSAQIQEIVTTFTKERAYALIEQRLDALITIGVKELNYLWFTEDLVALQALSALPYIEISDRYYVYVRPSLVIDKEREASRLAKILEPFNFWLTTDKIRLLMLPQENRYVKIAENMNARLVDRILEQKRSSYDALQSALAKKRSQKKDPSVTLTEEEQYYLSLKIPLLHGVGLEQYQKRYYPHGSFASHILWYIDPSGKWLYGTEEFFDKELRGKDGKVVWLATPWIGEVGANNFVIEKAQDGMDIYLSFDPIIQKEVEVIANQFRNALLADSIAVTVLDPWTGKIKALVNAPDFDPNNVAESYQLLPIDFDHRKLIENPTYVDIPLYYMSWENMLQASFNERQLPDLKKYYFKNLLGPQTFIDKNISASYEPGSIMKAVSMGVAVDSDMISVYDFYNDPGKVQVGEHSISNVSNLCKWDHPFLHALEFSCNVGMVRIAQKLSKYVFYNYFERLWFGKKTWIELAAEDAGRLPDYNNVPLVQFFNNTYGQGMLATPLQMAITYAALINGWTLYAPSIVDSYVVNGVREMNPPRAIEKIFKETTSDTMRKALQSVVEHGLSRKFYKPWYSLGAKSGTSQIAFRGKYQNGAWWTNGSMMGLITAENPKYVIAVQVKRPRSSPWWDETAGKVFDRVTNFLLNYERIEK